MKQHVTLPGLLMSLVVSAHPRLAKASIACLTVRTLVLRLHCTREGSGSWRLHKDEPYTVIIESHPAAKLPASFRRIRIKPDRNVVVRLERGLEHRIN